MCRGHLIAAAVMPAAGVHSKILDRVRIRRLARSIEHANSSSSLYAKGSECGRADSLFAERLGACLSYAANPLDRWIPAGRRCRHCSENNGGVVVAASGPTNYHRK